MSGLCANRQTDHAAARLLHSTFEQVVVHTLSQWNPSYFKGTAYASTAVPVVPRSVCAFITLRRRRVSIVDKRDSFDIHLGNWKKNATVHSASRMSASSSLRSPNRYALARVCILVHYVSIRIIREVLGLREF